ncbi:miraculin-like [Andrographis paniculata]|uniref:miraculin-like n=1 Tax=Andrographis paniculata TaxID=175694 RepID=UPI0021E8236D|nr:miraculin-like [Andrographis paniculata]
MKTFIIFLFVSVLVGSFICTYSAMAKQPSNNDDDDLVRDSDGDPLVARSGRYIVLAPQGISLVLSKYPYQQDCEHTLSQEIMRYERIPCSFHPANASEPFIRRSKSFNVKFEMPVPQCTNSTLWQVSDEIDSVTNFPLIQIGGVEGNPNCKTAKNWFKISKDLNSTYGFVWYPSDVCHGTSTSRSLIINENMSAKPFLCSDSSLPSQFIFMKG